MKMKVRDIVFLYQTLNKIASKDTIAEAPVDIKFLLVRNARVIQDIAVDFDETRKRLAIENSTAIEGNEDGERRATKEQLDYINAEIAKLENVEVEVAVSPVTLEQLECLKLDLPELSGLYPIIQEGT